MSNIYIYIYKYPSGPNFMIQTSRIRATTLRFPRTAFPPARTSPFSSFHVGFATAKATFEAARRNGGVGRSSFETVDVSHDHENLQLTVERASLSW